MDYYNRLGVNKTASPDEIKRAYKKLAMQHHPDRGGDQTTFQEINEAYDTLKDPNKKAAYDNPQPRMNINTGNMNDIFSSFFNNGRPMRRNPDITINVKVKLEDIVNGTNIIGKYLLRSGEEVVATINVPAGIESGTIIQLRGMGDNIYPNLPRGNLLAKIMVASHPNYVRDRLHLRTKCSINVLELMLGTEVKVEKLGGGTIELKVPKGTNPGTVLSVPGYGIKDYRTQRTGNLYVEIKGVTPKLDRYEDIDRIRKFYDELNSRS